MTTETTQKLVADFKVLAADTQELIKATAEQSGEKIAAARDKARLALANVQARAIAAEAAAAEKAKAAAGATDEYVRSNPWTAIGVTAGIGFLIGYLVGRR